MPFAKHIRSPCRRANNLFLIIIIKGTLLVLEVIVIVIIIIVVIVVTCAPTTAKRTPSGRGSCLARSRGSDRSSSDSRTRGCAHNCRFPLPLLVRRRRRPLLHSRLLVIQIVLVLLSLAPPAAHPALLQDRSDSRGRIAPRGTLRAGTSGCKCLEAGLARGDGTSLLLLVRLWLLGRRRVVRVLRRPLAGICPPSASKEPDRCVLLLTSRTLSIPILSPIGILSCRWLLLLLL